jgi:hypothetical protein
MLDLTTVLRSQSVPHDRIVDAQQSHPRIVAQGFICRADDIGEENRPDCRVSLVACTARAEHGSRGTGFTSAKKCLYQLGLDLDNSFRHLPVCFTVHQPGGVRIGRIDEAESLAVILVEPVFEILDAVLALLLEVGGVRLVNLYRGCSLEVMDVHIQGHCWLRKNCLPRPLGHSATYHARVASRKVGPCGCNRGVPVTIEADYGAARVRSCTGLKSSSHRHGAVIVAVPVVWMMKMSFHQIVAMTAVRDRFMSATSPMRVLGVMRAARMSRGTGGWIRATLRQSMLIDMPLVGAVQMPVMQIIDVTFVFDRGMPAAWTVRMGVLVMRFVVAHVTCLLPIGCLCRIHPWPVGN